MRHILQILVLLILISCSNNKEQKRSEIEIKSDKEMFENAFLEIDTAQIDGYFNELKIWLCYYKQYSILLRNFEFIKQENLPNITSKIDTLDYSDGIYEPYYKYSIDSSMILDLISYNLLLEINEKNELVSFGGDVDSEVSIKYVKNKLWKRLLFVGPFYIIEDGFWINNDQILIVGEFNETDEIKFKPSIWFVDLSTNIIQTFIYNKYIENMNCNYLENVRYNDIKMAE